MCKIYYCQLVYRWRKSCRMNNKFFLVLILFHLCGFTSLTVLAQSKVGVETGAFATPGLESQPLTFGDENHAFLSSVSANTLAYLFFSIDARDWSHAVPSPVAMKLEILSVGITKCMNQMLGDLSTQKILSQHHIASCEVNFAPYREVLADHFSKESEVFHLAIRPEEEGAQRIYLHTDGKMEHVGDLVLLPSN